ncbi:MAG: DNA-binding protein [Gammaproteobacteria bacterium]|nr:DNA-binding protein [Gammaproteobacteria bacterium]
MILEIVKCEGKRPLAPRESHYTREFWSKLSTGEFTSTRCQVCRKLMFPPRQHCPMCWSKKTDWVSLSGKGKLYARTTVHAGPLMFQQHIPYSVGIIDLDEGVRLIASIIDGDEKIQNDEEVQLIVLAYDDGPLFAVRKIESD